MTLALPASAQLCPGDTNGDLRVSVDEVIGAVNSALDGCRPPTLERCPTGLDDAAVPNPACTWIGSYNHACGARIMLTLIGRNTLMVGLTPREPLGFSGVFNPNGTGRYVHYNIGENVPTGGTASIDAATGDLIVDGPVFGEIATGCRFEGFRGEFIGLAYW